MTEPLLWEPSSRKVWENWEEIARGKLGVTTQTLLLAIEPHPSMVETYL